MQDLFLKVTEKEAGQQLAEGVALAHSAQVMEIQDMDYEINELGQIKKGHRGLQCWSCRGLDPLQEIVKWVVMMMINSMDLIERLVICAIPS